METLYAITALASAFAAVLAWVAKLRWSREFSAAKEAQIAAKQAELVVLEREVAALRELTPMRVREYFLSVKEQLEEYNDRLRWERDEAIAALEEKTHEIAMLERKGDDVLAALSQLDRAKLARVASILERHLRDVAIRHEIASKVTADVINQLPRLEPSMVEELRRIVEIARRTVLEVDASKFAERSIQQDLDERQSLPAQKLVPTSQE